MINSGDTTSNWILERKSGEGATWSGNSWCDGICYPRRDKSISEEELFVGREATHGDGQEGKCSGNNPSSCGSFEFMHHSVIVWGIFSKVPGFFPVDQQFCPQVKSCKLSFFFYPHDQAHGSGGYQQSRGFIFLNQLELIWLQVIECDLS